jgi:tetratricopeptide (TPR) repeat protein
VSIEPLRPPDSHHLKAAQGWIELGDHIEADAELDNITPELRMHPDALKLRWQIYANAEKWDMCADLGSLLVTLAPERVSSWLHRSQALHRLKRTQEASDQLQPAADLFPRNWRIRYDLACYACRLGNNKKTRGWLEDAFHLGNKKLLKFLALGDPDLEPFWSEIGEV